MADDCQTPECKRRREECSRVPKPDERQPSGVSDIFLSIENNLCRRLLEIDYSPSGVDFIYNPIDYASDLHSCFVHKYCTGPKKVLFLGMNPGPFGMAQNGVPFGDVSFVKEWLAISGSIRKPIPEHPKRPILGLASTRNEVSGTRFWGLMKELSSTPEAFFTNCHVHNYCPLCFMTTSGKNVTPPSMKVSGRDQLQAACDSALLEVVELLQVQWVVGVGKYAEQRAKKAVKEFHQWQVAIGSIAHPSPINPAANRGWGTLASRQLAELGVLELVAHPSDPSHAQTMIS